MAYIRDLLKGQKAMITAMLYPDAARIKRKGSGSLATKQPGFSAALLSQARTVLRVSPVDP
jgi:hypothetical protein